MEVFRGAREALRRSDGWARSSGFRAGPIPKSGKLVSNFGKFPSRTSGNAPLCAMQKSPPIPSERQRRHARAPGKGSSTSRHEMLSKFRQTVARFRLYRHRSIQENMRFAAFFKIYQISKLKFLKFGKILQILRHLHFFNFFA